MEEKPTMDSKFRRVLVAASRDVVILLCGFGVLAGALSLMRTAPRKARGADESEQVGAL